MATISYIEQQYFENMFQMAGGLVLEFSNAQFQRFVADSIGIDIYVRYAGLSKAKILRAIIKDFDDVRVGNLLLELLEFKKIHLRIADDEKAGFLKCVEIGHKMIGKSMPQAKVPESPVAHVLNYEKFHARLMGLVALTDPQKRGYALELYLSDLFEESNLQPRGSFRIQGEQIDGSFCLAGEIYLLEAKWQSLPTDKADLVVFNEKVHSKSAFTRGLFFSWNGFAPLAVETLNHGREVRIVLMDGRELAIVMERRIDFKAVLERKIRCLAEEGKCYKVIDELI